MNIIGKLQRMNELNEKNKDKKVKYDMKVRSASNKRIAEIEKFRDNLHYIRTVKSVKSLERLCLKLNVIENKPKAEILDRCNNTNDSENEAMSYL